MSAAKPGSETTPRQASSGWDGSSLPSYVRWLFWAGKALSVGIWLWAFPVRSPIPRADFVFELVCLVGALVALFYVQRIRFAPIEIGWRLFLWGLMIQFLSVLTEHPQVPAGATNLLEDGPETLGVIAVVWGFFRFWQTRRQELDALAYQLKFEHLSNDLSRSFVATTPDELDGRIQVSLGQIGNAYQLDRVGIWLFDEGHSSATPRYTWDRVGIAMPPALRPADVPWTWTQILSGRKILFESTDQMPDHAEPDRSLLAQLGIKSLFCAHLKVGETSLGACGFATLREHRRWREREVRDLTTLSEIIACAAARSRAHQSLLRREAALSEQLEFQRFVAELSRTFLTVPEKEIDRHVNLAFRRIAEAFELDHVSLWRFDADGETSSFSHVWVQSGAPPPRTILRTEAPWVREQVLGGHIVSVESPDQLPPEAQQERQYFAKTQIQSLLIIPHTVGGSCSAASVFSTVRKKRQWSAAAIEQLRFLGEIVVSAVERSEADHALLQRDEELAHAQRIAHVGSYAFLPDNGETHFSDELLHILGREPQEASLGFLLESIHADDRKAVADAIQRAIDGESSFEQECRLVRPDGSVRSVNARGEVERNANGDAVRVLGTILDITERKESEQALSRALSQLKVLKDQLEAENLYLRDEVRLTQGFDEIVGGSRALRKCLQQVEQVATTDSTVLILGETGTGKELIAHSIHDLSERKNGPLVSVNCAALQPTLIEAELFGHERGAFTGAQARRHGRFEIADGGTLFLDEIGDLPLELQSKLLRVLQAGEFERVGGSQRIRVNVRLIAATNRDLERAVERGSFRADLFYRLNVFPIVLPPLRERKEDIPVLVKHFVAKHARRLGRDVQSVSGRMLEKLASLPWPGNVRELENWILRALVTSRGSTLDLDVEEQLAPTHPNPAQGLEAAASELKDVERSHILKMLEEANWVIEGERGAAARLGLNPSTLRSRMRKLGIKRSELRSRSSGASL